MISRTLGAPLGGTTRGGQEGLESAALRSILPSNFGGGGGSCFPSMVVVAPGEPGTPMTSPGRAGAETRRARPLAARTAGRAAHDFMGCLLRVPSTLSPSDDERPLDRLHLVGRRQLVLQELSHDPQVLADVAEELPIAVAEIVKPGL